MTVHVWIEAGMTDWRTDGITRRIFQRPHSADWRTYCRCIKETSTRCTAASASRSVVAMSSFYSRTAFLVVSVLTAWNNSKGHLTFLHVAAIITNVVLYCLGRPLHRDNRKVDPHTNPRHSQIWINWCRHGINAVFESVTIYCHQRLKTSNLVV